MQLGLVLTGVAAGERTAPAQLKDALALAHAARDHGYSHFVVGQRFLGAPYRNLQPIPMLGRLAPETSTMRLVIGVLLLPLLHPVDVAEQLSTLDVIADGRLTVALGTGYRDEEFAAFGVERRSRTARMLECLELVERLWTGEPVDHEGRFFTLRRARIGIRPLQAPGPEVWLAAMTDQAIARAASSGRRAFVGPRASRAQVRHWLDVIRAAAGDRSRTAPLRRDVFVGASRAAALDRARTHVGARLADYRAAGMSRGLAGEDTASAGPEDQDAYLAERLVIGDAAECAETIRAYWALGASPLVLRVQWPGIAITESLRMIEELHRRL